jgi:hypothetical protein
MELLRGLAQGGVVLLNKIPCNLLLGQIIARRIGVSGTRGSSILLGCTLLHEAAVCRHGGQRLEGERVTEVNL